MNRFQYRPHREGLFLHNEINRKKLRHRVNICFAGSEGSGRNTLATRLKDIDKRAYPSDFIISRRNTHVVCINLDQRPNVRKTGDAVLIIYLEPRQYRRTHFIEWLKHSLISLIVFCFDVNEEGTFYDTRKRIAKYIEILGENFPPYIVLGNKIDLRDRACAVGNRDGVPTEFAELKMKEWWPAAHYFECSAWKNEGVKELLDFILDLVL